MTVQWTGFVMVAALGLAIPGAVAQDAASGPAFENAEPVAAMSVTERLESIGAAWWSNARLEIELPADASEDVATLAAVAQDDWNTGRYDAALVRLDELESMTTFAAGIAWRTPVSSGLLGPGFGDVRVGFPRENAESAALDYDAQNGNLFAVVRWGEPEMGWTVNISIDGGVTWFETYYWWDLATTPIDVDAAVVGDYLYVAYVAGNQAEFARLRRMFVLDGASDDDYFYETVFDATPDTIRDVALATNADDYDNRIYYAAIETDNTIRYAWDVAADATTFVDESPAGVSADRSLDLHWNENGTVNWFLFLSYLGTDGFVHVMRHDDPTWEDATFDTSAAPFSETSISAFANTVICGFELEGANGQGIRYRISYNAGDGWAIGTLANPDPGEGGCHGVHLTARGGDGTAILYGQEVGEPDPIWFRRRDGYPGTSGWTPPVAIADYDLVTGTPIVMNQIPPFAGATWAYGALYLSGDNQSPYPYFLRVPSTCPADITGPAEEPDGNVDALDYLLLIAQWGDLCGGECAADITGPNLVPDGTVDALDFLLLISQWGNPGQCPPSP